MEGIKYVNLIEIGPVVIEIQRVENGELTVPVNNTLVSRTAFLAADTRPCVLIELSTCARLAIYICAFNMLYFKKPLLCNERRISLLLIVNHLRT